MLTGEQVFIRAKPTPEGLKMYKLNDSSGYCLVFEIYIRGAHQPSALGATHDVIARLVLPPDRPSALRLTSGGVMKPYTLYADNYYGSLATAMWLRSLGIGFVSILRSNRSGIPEALANTKLRSVGDSDWLLREDGLVALVLWRDVCATLMFVTTSKPPTWPSDEKPVTLGRWQRGKLERTQVTAPPPAVGYRANMGSVCIRLEDVSTADLSLSGGPQ
jgi:hypothetical protein